MGEYILIRSIVFALEIIFCVVSWFCLSIKIFRTDKKRAAKIAMTVTCVVSFFLGSLFIYLKYELFIRQSVNTRLETTKDYFCILFGDNDDFYSPDFEKVANELHEFIENTVDTSKLIMVMASIITCLMTWFNCGQSDVSLLKDVEMD